MNTPAHLVVNLAVLAGGERRAYVRSIALGALLPDLPIYLFFLWQWGVVGESQRVIWGEAYFRAGWQDFFDVFNSVPLALAGLLAARAAGRPAAVWLCASVLLHAALDLPLHHDDAHRHFFPFSDWRFESPVSYWDPAWLGALGAGIETAALLAGAWVLWRRHPGPPARAALALVCALYAALWALVAGGALG